MKFGAILGGVFLLLSACWRSPAGADLQVGEKAVLFKSVNENLTHVDMAEFIDGRPLVLLVGSCS